MNPGSKMPMELIRESQHESETNLSNNDLNLTNLNANEFYALQQLFATNLGISQQPPTNEVSKVSLGGQQFLDNLFATQAVRDKLQATSKPNNPTQTNLKMNPSDLRNTMQQLFSTQVGAKENEPQ